MSSRKKTPGVSRKSMQGRTLQAFTPKILKVPKVAEVPSHYWSKSFQEPSELLREGIQSLPLEGKSHESGMRFETATLRVRDQASRIVEEEIQNTLGRTAPSHTPIQSPFPEGSTGRLKRIVGEPIKGHGHVGS